MNRLHITTESAGAFARNITSVLIGVSAVAALVWFWAGPRVTEWAKAQLGTHDMADALDRIEATQQAQAVTQQQQQATIATISETQSQTAETLRQVVDRIADLERTGREDKVPPIRFMQEGHSISNGQIGGFVRVEFRYVKSRDCGRPVAVAYFRNGGGIVHAFADKSTTAEDGRGSSAMVSTDVQSVRFLARIPDDEGVQPTGGSYATGWVLVSWPNCPNVPEVRSPAVPFQILPADAG